MRGGVFEGRRWARVLVAVVVVGLVGAPAAGREKKEKEKGDQGAAASSPVIARVNGEDVTKSEFDAVLKANQRFFDLTSQSVRARLRGRPLTEFLFWEEIVKIRAIAQRHKDALPDLKAAIDKIHERISAGADFAEVAKEVSQEPGSAARGGALGRPQEFTDLVAPFNHVALSARKEGEVLGPVLTIFGYHLIKVDKIYPPMPTEGKEKRVDVRHILLRLPSSGGDPRVEADEAAKAARVEIVDPAYCKKLPSFCGEEAGS